MKTALAILALALTGCTTIQKLPPPRTATLEWNGVRISYTLSNPPLSK